MKQSLAIAAAILAATTLAGCASTPLYGSPQTQTGPTVSAVYPYPTASRGYPAVPARQADLASSGVVDSIQASHAGGSAGIGPGAVIGGLVGGILGNQVGGGSGKTAATVAGAIGGAVVGNQIEQRQTSPRQMYQVGVRLDNGRYQTVLQDNVADLRIGSRVRIENETAYRD